MACVLSGCTSGNRGVFRTAFHRKPAMEDVARAYYEGCVCADLNTFKKHNCTHYLSNALIEAGYTELLDSPLITVRCTKGRPVRAQELLKWFQSKAKRFSEGRPEPNTGFWLSYQEKPGGRHVVLLDSNTGKFHGTADCPKWPVQWNYQW